MFQSVKLFIAESVELANDALHIYVALFVFLGVCLIFRWKVSNLKPWLIVLVIAVLGEVLDIRDSLKNGFEIKPDYHWTDIWNTMLVPTVLLIAARYTSIFERPIEFKAASADDSEKGAQRPPSQSQL
uniref:hypothetical protein n=1 Tax=uncultured Erythrobacter sp. TaxID=263913 RepID=UPI00262E2858|nr:hypothetical protein [uncultured Erythrobacter sp.]